MVIHLEPIQLCLRQISVQLEDTYLLQIFRFLSANERMAVTCFATFRLAIGPNDNISVILHLAS